MGLFFSLNYHLSGLGMGFECRENLTHFLGQVPHEFSLHLGKAENDSSDFGKFVDSLEAFQKKLIDSGIDTDHAPYVLAHEKPTEIAVMIIHGYGGTPRQSLQMAQSLYRQGFNVLSNLLYGHARKSQMLDTLSQDIPGTFQIWRDNIAQGFDIATRLGKRVVVVGFSMGGALSLDFLVKKSPAQLAGFCGNGIVLKESPLAHRVAKNAYDKHMKWISEHQQALNAAQISPEDGPNFWADSQNPALVTQDTFINGAYVRVPTLSMRFIPAAVEQLSLKDRTSQGTTFALNRAPVLLINSEYDKLVDPRAIPEHKGLFENATLYTIPKEHKVSHTEMLIGHPKFDPGSVIGQWIKEKILESK